MNGNTPLLSRVADSVYWMARYMERAENVARFIGVNLNLQFDLPLNPANQWQPLIDTSGDTAEFSKRYGQANQDNVVQFLTYDADNFNSIFCCLRGARENARSVRETISSEMWAQVNSMYLQMQEQPHVGGPEALPELFRSIRLGCHMFQGITDATMTHNEAWHFVRLGRKLERADKTSRILDVKYFMLLPSLKDVGTPYDDIQWSAVLKSVSGFEMYRKKFGRIEPRDIVDFLVMDRDFPRSVHYSIRTADESLHAITGTPMGAFAWPSERLTGMLRAELDFTSVNQIIRDGLHGYLDQLQMKMNAIDAGLSEDFFAGTPEDQAVATQSQSG
ncbi:MAG TPA: alpha-E domain-containing protein [Bryobacteraceae bacterium]|nr:alpha-E domain-containing protein [Bryobacteraceae bacterium]